MKSWQLRKTSCPAGHPYDANNTRITTSGSRVCRTCHYARMRAANANKLRTPEEKQRRRKRGRIGDAPAVRIFRAVAATGNVCECWEWTGFIRPDGYGTVSLGGKGQRAHRAVFELLRGSIPDGLVIDHLCRNRSCVNPWHLEPVPIAENTRRGDAALYWKSKTHCPRGHAYDDTNTRRYRGRRQCLACVAIWHRIKYPTPLKLNLDLARRIRARRAEGALHKEIAAEFNISPATSSHVCNGRTWRDV